MTTFQEAVHYHGLCGAARAYVAARLHQRHPQLAIICDRPQLAERLIDDLRFFCPNTLVLHFPTWETLPFEQVSPQPDLSARRLHTLIMSGRSSSFIVVTSVEAIIQRVLPRAHVKELSFSLAVGETIKRNDLLLRFDRAGYQRVSLVEEMSEMAVRGGVIDCFTASHPQPLRIEFFGDRIERIKCFDPESQRSISELERVEIFPVAEVIDLTTSTAQEAGLLKTALDRIKSRAAELETPPRETATQRAALREGRRIPGLELTMAIALEKLETFFDYLPDNTLMILDDQIGIERSLEDFHALATEREERLTSEQFLIPSFLSLYLNNDELTDLLSRFEQRLFNSINLSDGPTAAKSCNLRAQSNIELTTQLHAQVGTGHGLDPLRAYIDRFRSRGQRVAIAVGSSTRAQRLQRQLLDLNLDAQICRRSGLAWIQMQHQPPLAIFEEHLSEGCQLPTEGVILISENEIFAQRSYRQQATTSQRSVKRLLSSLANLKDENYIVHEDYGVGIYRGLVHLQVEGTASDFLQIDYADSRLYLPIQNIGKIQKYQAAEGQTPALDKLGSQRWIKTKQKVREAVVTLAGDLIRLYAARRLVNGWRYDPAGSADEFFAESFPFNETPDQLNAIQDTLADLAREQPMDRLICGDVGFGKTEVAIRAAYKVLQHSRQVAVLAPTTILVEQHLETFRERFREYPFRIGALSRFYRPQDNKQTLSDLATGKLDIVIGTHKLLQRDVRFKDLGLLIIDEEHRFGVKQKEILKRMKTQVDVLTLTATPIPRTMYMSLLNLRDISVITTPPVDRRIVRTYLAERSDTIIRDALLREHQRGGQSFFVHNRVQSIAAVTHALHELVPEVRIEYGHGQMTERELERIMHRFIHHQIDVLVCTTIIESGVDIPNANTIIIDQAHQFGLAQLYQLRGRVGRSTRQAYAYLLVPPMRRLGAEAQERLKVLQSLDDLGLGFNLALRDLEIRGAGNLLGREQSGNVQAVGYELYSKILKEAVLTMTGEEIALEEIIDPEVNLGFSAYIPEPYIPDISERLMLYQRLAGVYTEQEVDNLTNEIEDRFGPYGEEVSNLLELMRLRALLRQTGIVRADYTGTALALVLSPQAHLNLNELIRLAREHPHQYKFGKSLTFTILLEPQPERSPADIYRLTAQVLDKVVQT